MDVSRLKTELQEAGPSTALRLAQDDSARQDFCSLTHATKSRRVDGAPKLLLMTAVMLLVAGCRCGRAGAVGRHECLAEAQDLRGVCG